MKRKSTDFTIEIAIEVHEGTGGKYWSQLVNTGTINEKLIVWQMKEMTDSRSEAFDLACNRLDAMTEKWLEEGETEDDGSGISEEEHAKRNGVNGAGHRL